LRANPHRRIGSIADIFIEVNMLVGQRGRVVDQRDALHERALAVEHASRSFLVVVKGGGLLGHKIERGFLEVEIARHRLPKRLR
jgi:hypothetical protein